MSDAFAAYRDGELVAEQGDVDSPAVIMSGSKGLIAVSMLLLIDRGLLSLDDPVARHWPGFRDDVLVRHVVSHTSGVAGLQPPPSAEEVFDDVAMEKRVEQQEPFWPPGTTLAYHGLTFGWLCGGLVRRIDGRTVGAFFADEVARPLALEAWIGRPARQPAVLSGAAGYGFRGEPSPLLDALYGPTMNGLLWKNLRVHEPEIPGVNAVATARSVARLYDSLDRVLSADAIRLGRTELSRGTCAVTGGAYAFGAGFELQTELGALGPPADAFGHTGSGGGSHGYWPTQRVGFSFLPTELRSDDTRATELLQELYDALSD